MKRILFIFILFLFLLSCSTAPSLPKIPLSKSVVASLNIYDQTITFIDAITKETTLWSIPKPFKQGILLSSDQLLLLNKESDKAYLYQLSTGISEEWKVGEGIETGLFSSQEKLYLADQSSKKIKLFSMEGELLQERELQHTPYIIFEDKNYIYVSYLDHPSISVHSKVQLETQASFPTHKGAAGGFITKNNELWLGGHGSGVHIQEDIYIYDLSNRKLKTKVNAPLMPIAFQTKGESVYVLSHGSNLLREIDLNSYETIRSVEVGANPFSMSLFHNELYISNYDANEIGIIDLDRFRKKQTIPVGDGPLQLIIREGITNEE